MNKLTRHTILSTLLFIVMSSVILFARRSDAIINPQFWAEDGVVFFQQAIYEGGKSLLLPHAGYLNLAPRAVAILATILPILYAPAFYNYTAFALTIIAGVIVLHSRIDISNVNKYLLALTLVLVPHGGEVFLTITNIQWIFAPIIPLIAIQSSPSNTKQLLLDMLILFLVGLNGPFIVIFSVLFFLRLVFLHRSKYDIIIALEVLVLSAIQLYILYISNANELMSSISITWITAFFINFVAGITIGATNPESLMPFFWVISAVFYTGLIALIIGNGKSSRVKLLILFIASFSVFSAALYSARNDPATIHAFFGGQRYFYIPYVCVWWALIISLSNINWTRYIAYGLLIVGIGASFTRFSWPPLEDYHWADYVALYEQGEHVTAPINPPGWKIILDPAATHR